MRQDVIQVEQTLLSRNDGQHFLHQPLKRGRGVVARTKAETMEPPKPSQTCTRFLWKCCRQQLVVNNVQHVNEVKEVRRRRVAWIFFTRSKIWCFVVQKAVFGLTSALSGTCRYPLHRSNQENQEEQDTKSRDSSTQGSGYESILATLVSGL